MSPVVIGMFGPTGVGKTAVAVELARRLSETRPAPGVGVASAAGGEAFATGLGSTPGRHPDVRASPAEGRAAAGRPRVISCDSMQVYRGFPVLTNQPSADEAEAVAHALVGFVGPDEEYSVAQYATVARPLIEADLAIRGWALVAGGTGLYMRAALAPLAAAPRGDHELRARLEARATSEGLDLLYRELASLDPEAAARIDPRNQRRVVRALEAIHVSGKQWSGRSDLWEPDYYHPTLLVGLTREREELRRRIDVRAAQMLQQGAVEEVRRFRDTRAADEARPGGPGIRSAIGYSEICRLLDGEQTMGETVELIAAATRRYARRQLTWLRKLKDAVIIDAQDREPGEIAQEILEMALSGDHTRGPYHA